MKIVLLSPKGPLYKHKTGIFKKNLRVQPLTLTTLAAYVPPELNATVEIYDEGIGEIDLNIEADLIGITAITGTAPRSYELSAHFRSRGIPVVLGGPHVTLMPEEAIQHADTIVTGYAEQTWPQLLRDFKSGRMKKRYDMAPDFSLNDIAELPFPRRDLLPKNGYLTQNTFEATRGCVHSCDFCVVPAAWGTKPFQKPIDYVLHDIKQMNAKKFVFYDLNLIADKEYAKALFRELAKLKVKWYGLATTLMGYDDELLKLAHESGCSGLLLGFESVSPAALRGTNKNFNSPAKFKEIVKKLHDYNIMVMGTFLFGLDQDTKETFELTAEFAIDSCIDLPRFAIVTPFPSTALYKRLKAENRILTEDWTLYDGQHVVFQPKNLSVDELYQGHEWAWKKVYSYPSIMKRVLGSGIQIPLQITTNIGYRFYAYNLHRFYTCNAGYIG
ncbi:B12-binding domain-containing radical SAM protein [Brevibacillus sp. H7]|uniref:B12-binding domain-containing radical SAM protein n=1 Tax=Brevibacillus sp. H7 TaxID=3349138 RepID=UPI0037FE6D77